MLNWVSDNPKIEGYSKPFWAIEHKYMQNYGLIELNTKNA